jgi:hypothetical protein
MQPVPVELSEPLVEAGMRHGDGAIELVAESDALDRVQIGH